MCPLIIKEKQVTLKKIQHSKLILYTEFKYEIKLILRLRILTQGLRLHFPSSGKNKGRNQLLGSGKRK